MENVEEGAAPTTAETPQATLDKLQPAEYDKWRMSGELPEPKNEESATSQDTSGAAPAEGKKPEPGEPAKPAPESEAGKAQEAKPEKKNAASRITELLADRARERERADKAEAALRDREAKRDEKKAASLPARPEPKETDLDDDGQPKYATLEDYVRDLADWKADEKFSAFKAELAQEKAEADKAKKKAETEEQNKAIEASWQKRVKEAGKHHADFNDTVFGEDSAVARIPQGSMMDSYILEAEAGAELLYHLAQHGEEVDRIAALGPAAQARELAKLEISLSDNKPPEKKKFSTTPNPPAEVAGRGIAADDPVVAAVKAGDFERYMREANAEDLKRGQRG